MDAFVLDLVASKEDEIHCNNASVEGDVPSDDRSVRQV